MSKRTEIIEELKAIFSLAWPVMGAQFLQLSMVFVDNVMVGHLGAEPLAALALASSLFSMLFVMGIGVLTAMSPMVAQAFGGNAYEKIGLITRQGLIIGLGLAISFSGILFLSDPIFRFLGQDPKLFPVAKEYLRVVGLAFPAFYCYIAIRQTTEGTSFTKASFIVALIGSLVNIVADYCLVFGKFGFPRLEVRGAAFATTAVSWAMLGSMLVYLKITGFSKKFCLWGGSFRPHRETISEALRLGIPLGGMWLFEVGFFISATLLMGTIGTMELAAHQIALNAASFTFMIPLGLSIALGIRVGQFVGKDDWQGVRRAGAAGFVACVVIQLILAMIFLLFARQIASIYTNEKELIEFGASFLMIAGAFQLFDGIQVVGSGSLRGLKDTKIPLGINIFSYWMIGLPVIWLLTFRIGVKPYGIWWGILAGLFVASVLHHTRFYLLTRRKDYSKPTSVASGAQS